MVSGESLRIIAPGGRFSNVLLTMIQKMEVESGSFQDATGTLDGLT